MAQRKLKYSRVLLKLTGDLFGNEKGKGINFEAFNEISEKIIRICKETKVQLAIVVGGGNIFRGRERDSKVDEPTADYMGMLATVINGMALQEAFERHEMPTRMMTAFEIKAVAEPYIRRRAIRHLEKGRVVIFTAGIGSPFFTTDTGAALRAVEINCDVLIKATNVDGIYSEDPKKNSHAKLHKKLNYNEVIKKELQIMDTAAFTLCRKHKIPIIVFNIKRLNDLTKIIKGSKIGTIVCED